jgi:hypothetical protein
LLKKPLWKIWETKAYALVVEDDNLIVIFKEKTLQFEFSTEHIKVDKILTPKKQYSNKEFTKLKSVVLKGENFGEKGLKNIINIVRPKTFGDKEKIEDNRYYNTNVCP